MTLTLRDLGVSRGGVRLLEGINAELGPGQALILGAPNGAGKTALLRTLAGLQPPDRGQITPGPEAMAYAGHADALKAALSVEENLAFWAAIFGAGDLAPAIETFRLAPLLDRAAGELSSGQKRRLGLARLMLSGRPIWLLDEPTVSLDVAAVGWFRQMVETHLATGGSAVIATHIDLGLDATTLDLAPFKARLRAPADGGF